MAVDNQYLRIRRSLEEKLGVEEASYLMDRPPGGWSELVTNQTVGLRFDVVDERFRGLDERFRGLDERFRAIDARFDVVDERFRAIDARFDVVDERLRAIDVRFAAVDAHIDALRHELTAEMERGFRRQTWALLSVSITGFTAVLAAIVTVGGAS